MSRFSLKRSFKKKYLSTSELGILSQNMLGRFCSFERHQVGYHQWVIIIPETLGIFYYVT